METKDYVYLGLIALTAAVFYWHGYLAARARTRKAKTAASVFTPVHRQSSVQVPMHGLDSTQPVHDLDSTQPVRGHRIIRPAGFRKGRIRATFGVN
jgi:hypothetical protein